MDNVLDFNFKLKYVSGDPKAGTILGNALSQSPEHKMKFCDWAMKLYEVGTITVDHSDKVLLREWVEKHQSLQSIIGGQLLKAIDNAGKAKENTN